MNVTSCNGLADADAVATETACLSLLLVSGAATRTDGAELISVAMLLPLLPPLPLPALARLDKPTLGVSQATNCAWLKSMLADSGVAVEVESRPCI
jgi:hypothetical protein